MPVLRARCPASLQADFQEADPDPPDPAPAAPPVVVA